MQNVDDVPRVSCELLNRDAKHSFFRREGLEESVRISSNFTGNLPDFRYIVIFGVRTRVLGLRNLSGSSICVILKLFFDFRTLVVHVSVVVSKDLSKSERLSSGNGFEK